MDVLSNPYGKPGKPRCENVLSASGEALLEAGGDWHLHSTFHAVADSYVNLTTPRV
jgi:hypothetical protein